LGSIALPASGSIYLDANSLIYAVEKKAPYWSLLQPVWQAVAAGGFRFATSSLALLEVLVMPIRQGDAALVATYENSAPFGGHGSDLDR
jgi:hypothetical protein